MRMFELGRMNFFGVMVEFGDDFVFYFERVGGFGVGIRVDDVWMIGYGEVV